jgi:hypothetical protein
MNRAAIAAAVTAFACVGAGPVRAATFTQTLSTPTWANGATDIGDGNFTAAGPDPAPFDTFIGNKTTGPDPSTSFTFSSYGGPIASPITSATLLLGLYDGASPTPATEVSFFTLDGVSIASQLTAALVATPPVRNGEIYYTLALPGSVSTELASGSSTFSLGFTGQGEGLLGPSTFIAFGLDFATLSINTGSGPGGGGPSSTIPEPPAAALLLTGLLGLVALRRRGVG